MNRLILYILVMLCTLTLRAEKISDMGMARDWCDETMLRGPEGIWEFPDDETRVLIRRSAGYQNRYDIVVIDTPDTRLIPGDIIGNMKETALSTRYDMHLYRERKNGSLATPGHCLAEYNSREDALVVKSFSVKISLNLRYLLPSFWRTLRISAKNPAEDIPYGLVRIYPTKVRRTAEYL